ncbi:MAG: RadC family protein [Candidatus Izemoplasmataceae bacterium]
MFFIKEIPNHERPRERFMQEGAEALLTYELIAIILRTGSREDSVLELSKKILYQAKSLKALSVLEIEDLTKVKGIGPSKAIQLLAAFELGRRMHSENYQKRLKVHNPESIFLYLKDKLELKTQENLIGLFLNTKGELIKKETIFVGSLNTSVIHPREIFKEAVKVSAASIVIAHNHPSGDPSPSSQDIEITKRLHQNGLMMDIEVLDHIIVGQNKYFSFKEHGML